MPALPNPSRRHALKILAGAPMLPLSGVALPALLSGCGGDDDVAAAPPAAGFAAAAFASMAAPTLADPAAMATTTVGSTLSVSFTDGSTRNYKLAYRPFFVTGDRVPDGKGGTILAGGYYDINGQPIIDRSVPGQERQFYSDCPDGSSLLTLKNANVAGVKGNTVFAVVQFEYTTRDLASASQYGRLPSPIAVLTLDQDPATGALKLVKYHNVDTSAAHGACGSRAARACRRGTRTCRARNTSRTRRRPRATRSSGRSARTRSAARRPRTPITTAICLKSR